MHFVKKGHEEQIRQGSLFGTLPDFSDFCLRLLFYHSDPLLNMPSLGNLICHNHRIIRVTDDTPALSLTVNWKYIWNY